MRERLVAVTVFLIAAAFLVLGWHTFWFLCDDAYIAFRYVDHGWRGWGYVWNPAPFQPVEGYTSFLWVVLLHAVWVITGVEPPESANPLGLVFALGTLGVATALAWKMPLSPGLARWRLPLLALALFGIVSNRTFLAWTSSGLETSLVTFLLVSWGTVALLGRPLEDRRHLVGLVALASLLALTRPDGYLYCAASAAIGLLRLWRRRPRTPASLAAELAPALPFLVPVVHVLWRRWTYGLWLPNTYYAKHVAPWPQAGLPYAGSFLLEYGYWIWGLAALAGLAFAARSLRRARPEPATVARAIGVAALFGQVAYYVLLVGGDHFEFRIFQHLVPLLVITLPWITDRLGVRPVRSVGLLVLMLLIGLPIPWTHWAYTKDLNRREQTKMLRYKVAPHFPLPVRWYAWAWDEMQDFLISRFVGLRHQNHKNFWKFQLDRFPSREEGLRLPTEDWPIYDHISVGVPGWKMPTIPLIDKLGLSDAIIAASPPRTTDPNRRHMAHDRKPPRGYVGCFDPNVSVSDEGEVTIRPRKTPMTEERIRECERKFLTKARKR